jgi:hypothetical protein
MNDNTCALKEWQIAVRALEAGETIILLRKGGIREDRRQFQIKQPWVWLYPTYEHQKPELLKPEYAPQVTIVESGWHPETVRIGSRAKIVALKTTTELKTINRLYDYHIWNERFVLDRLNWQPKQPLHLLFLRVYRLQEPRIIPYHSSYGGCKSWIDLVESIDDRELIPVLDEQNFTSLTAQIQAIFTENLG